MSGQEWRCAVKNSVTHLRQNGITKTEGLPMIPELMVLRVAAPPASPAPDTKAAWLGNAMDKAAFGDLVAEMTVNGEPPPVLEAGLRHVMPDWPVDPPALTAAPVVLVPALVSVAGPFVRNGDAALVEADPIDKPEATGKGLATHPGHGLPPVSSVTTASPDLPLTVLPDVASSVATAHVSASDHAGEGEPSPVRAVVEGKAVNLATSSGSDPALPGPPVGPETAKPQAPDDPERLAPASPDAAGGEGTASATTPATLPVLSRPARAGAKQVVATAQGGGPAIDPIPSRDDVTRQPDAVSAALLQAERAVPVRPTLDRDTRSRILPDRPTPDAAPLPESPAVEGMAATMPKAAPSENPSGPATPPAPAAAVLAVLQAPARGAEAPQPLVKGVTQTEAAPAEGGMAQPPDASARSGSGAEAPTGSNGVIAQMPDRHSLTMPESPAIAPSDPALPLRHDPRSVEARHPAQPMPPTVAPMLVDAASALPDAPVTLTLAPEDLGALRFEMQSRGDTIHVSLTVERPETLDMLRRHVEQLTGEFRQAGFANASFSFAGGWGSGGQERAAGAGYASLSVDEDERPATRAGRHVNGGLDLRL